MRILISAAETSSDAHGAELLKAIQKENPTVEAFGVGGPKLQSVGLRTIVDARELLAMGFVEVLGRLPKVLRALRRVTEEASRTPPDLVVLIDYPDFHFRLAKRLGRLGVPLIYYIPPKLWVWRKRRAKFLKKAFTLVMCIFPFEKEFYQKLGISARYIGNPLVDELPLGLSKQEARRRLSLEESDPVLVLMPGSRPSELKEHFFLMLEAAQEAVAGLRLKKFLKEGEKLKVLLPLSVTTDLNSIRQQVSQRAPLGDLDLRLMQGNASECLVAADAGLIKSGTSTLEAGLLKCPHAVVYKTTPTTAWIFKNLIRFQGPVGLVNLVAGGGPQEKSRSELLVREILLSEVRTDTLAEEIIALMTDAPKRQKMIHGFEKLREKLQPFSESGKPCLSPSELAAKEVLDLFKNSSLAKRESLSGTRSLWKDSLFPRRIAVHLRKVALQMGSAVWGMASWVARRAAHQGWMKTETLGVRVVSIGNIQVGGAGKTPLVAKIANEAAARGLHVGILSRGYRSSWERGGGILLPGAEPADVRLCGDEAALLHQLCPHAIIGVGANRVKQFQALVRKSLRPIDLILLDDGFQHWRIRKDVEIVAVTSATPSEKLFRDSIRALKDADLVVWTKGEKKPDSAGRPMAVVRYRLPEAQTQEPFWLVSGVADGNFVRQVAQRFGYQISHHIQLEDHAAYQLTFVQEVLANARRGRATVLITGKDWVKWRALGVDSSQVIVLEPELIVEEGRDTWSQILWGE